MNWRSIKYKVLGAVLGLIAFFIVASILSHVHAEVEIQEYQCEW